MTNERIILNESIKLMNAGTIGTTGNIITVENPDGSKFQVNEPEPIHTFATWRALGYQVKRGEKSIAKIDIWKCTIKPVELKAKNESGDDVTITQDAKNMFLKTAFFFKGSQVEPITA